jgi:hypothetical protein
LWGGAGGEVDRGERLVEAGQRVEVEHVAGFIAGHDAAFGEAADVLAGVLHGATQQAHGVEEGVVAGLALILCEQEDVGGLLDALVPGQQGVHDVCDELLLDAGVGGGLLGLHGHDGLHAHGAADFTDLEGARLQVLGVDAG